MRRFFSSVLVVLILTGVLLVPVSAAEASGTADVSFTTGFFRSVSFPRLTNVTSVYDSSATIWIDNINVPPAAALNLSGSVGVYFSYYTAGKSSIVFWDGSTTITQDEYISLITSPSSWSLWYYDSNASDVPVTSSNYTIRTFTASNDSYSYKSPGISLSFKFNAGSPVQGFHIQSLRLLKTRLSSGTIYAFIPSFSVIATESSADLSKLEDIADGIAEGNDIAQAMYGDIMAALNAVKGDTSVMAECIQEALASLLQIQTNTSNIYSLCSTYLRYLADIAANTDSIDAELKAYHADFMQRMELLNSTIVDESENIQAKMEEIYNLLIAYLDSQYEGAINSDLVESTGNVQNDIDIQYGLEQTFESNLTQSWVDLKLQSFSLGGGYTSAMAWVSSWFTNFYNAMGDYGMIVLLPLFLGIVTMVTGLRRQAISRGPRVPDIPPLPTDPMLPKGRGK